MGILGFLASKHSLQESGVLSGATDRHSHILWGVDDGVKTPEDSLECLAYEESLGVKEVWCTPHIMEDVPNTTESLKERFQELCELYKGPIKLRLAAEYMMDMLFEERLKAGDILTMEDNIVLVETSTLAPPYDLDGIISATMSAGYRPMFAHPERCRYLGVGACRNFLDKGVCLQLNLASITGTYGDSAKKKAELMLEKGMYYAYGSDCHNSEIMKKQFSKVSIKSDIIKVLKSI